MKKKFILTGLVGGLLYLSLSSYYDGPGGHFVEGTAARGSSFAGCTCHSPSATTTNTVTMQLLSGGTPVTSYVPGTTYTLKIHGVNNGATTLPNFGFQMAVVTASTAGTSSATSTGTFGTPPSSTHTITVSGTSVTVFEHFNSTGGDGSFPATTGTGATGSTYDMTINWTAPAAGTGSVVLYGVENMVNHDGIDNSFDHWNTATAVTICESPAAITGTMTVCAGATTTLSDVTTGGTWSSGSTGVATVGTSGVVTGVSGGTAVISYTTSCATVTATVTVNAVSPGNFISAGGPTATECVGSTSLVLSNINPGGSWSSASTGVATVSGGTVSGVTSGTAVISYTLPSTGCAATTTVTVNALPTISGTLSLCATATVTLTATPTGGTWSSSSGLISVNSTTGAVTGLSSGNPVITYTSTSGCNKTAVMTVNSIPSAITGTLTLCQGGTTTLGDLTTGGTWSSSSTGVATVVASGSTSAVVTGVITGSTSPATATITYTNAAGCAVSKIVTVNPVPAAISPTSPTVCQGGTTVLTDATAGGTWSSVTTSVATVSGGTVSGVTSGTSLISYTLGTGCAATTTLTVNPSPPNITGAFALCQGANDSLHDAGSGSWASGSTSVATVDATLGVVTGVSAGTADITFFDGATFCPTSVTVTVNALPTVGAITGTPSACSGTCTTLNCTPAGGTWSGASGSFTVGSATGVVCGVSAGSGLVTYSVTNGFGCTGVNATTVTINALPGPIAGSLSVCMGSTSTLSDPTTPGGNWTSASTGVATIGPTTGTVSSVSPGTSVITYALSTGCTTTAVVTVNALPVVATPTGTLTVCVGSSTALSDATSSGVWTSSNTGVATVGSSSGIVTGVANGTANIVYTVTSGAGCNGSGSVTVTVNPLPVAITGTMNVCAGSTRALTDASSGGTWSSSNTSIATVTPSGTTTTVSGIAAGTVTISYALGTGCARTALFTVNPVPVPGAITGTTTVCQGATSPLSDTTAGGLWTINSTSVATVGSTSGLLSGVSAGSTTITYTVNNIFGCSAHVTTPVTVNANPGAISGASSLCAGTNITLTDITAGGTWSSSATGTATVVSSGTSCTVTGVAAGTATISYTVGGCSALKAITVNTSPAAMGGPSTVCVGQTITLTDATSGGAWTSSNTSQATVGSTGIVTGVAAGTPTISYTIGACSALMPITVNPLSPISGLSSACAGATTPLTDATGGGTWTSVTTSVATIGSLSGSLNAVSTGTSLISYTTAAGCVATLTFTVISTPSGISGSNHVCIGSTTALTDGGGGGTWTSSAPGTASVGSSSGIVTGVATGPVTITYSLGTGCTTTLPMTVNPLPSAIGGTTFVVCVGSSITLTDGTIGGSWSSTSSGVTVGSGSGSVTGVTAGTSTVSYTSGLGCSVTKNVTVNALPAGITGTESVCQGSTTTLSDATSGGTWSSTSTGTATVGSTTGSVSGITTGTALISYTLTGTGCAATATVTVNPLPATITGTTSVCVAATTTLGDVTPGGSWTIAPTSIATVGSSSGTITGVATGTAIVSYSLGTGCRRTATVTVNALPTAFNVTGGGTYCAGGTGMHIGLSGSQTGVSYQAYSGGTPVGSSATGTGSVLDLGTFTTAGTYTVQATNSSTGCGAAMTGTVTVSINPVPSPITGGSAVCVGLTTILADATIGGSWSSGSTLIATVGSGSGVVTGVSSGTATISYTDPTTGCSVTDVVTVNPLPLSITGTAHVCMGSTTTLSDLSSGGSWSSGTPGIATIGSTGIVTPVTVGVDTVAYSLPTGCIATIPVTVNPLPFAGSITGASSVCATVTITLSNTTSGGAWSSSNTVLATVGTSGIVSGLTAGVDTISYSVTNICGTAVASHTVTVNPQPFAGSITGGTPSVCMGTPVTFTDAAPGGVWHSSNAAVATVGSGSGTVSGISPGADSLLYTVSNICGSASTFKLLTVNPLPVAGTITGTDSVCAGDSISLSDAVGSGIWSVAIGNASVSATGVVTGLTAGTDTVKYAVTNTCGTATATFVVSVRPHADCFAGIHPVPSQADGFKVYPNPNGGSFTVEIPDVPNTTHIVISDVLGKTIQTRSVDAHSRKNVFDLGSVAPGSYFISVSAGDQVYRTKITVW